MTNDSTRTEACKSRLSGVGPTRRSAEPKNGSEERRQSVLVLLLMLMHGVNQEDKEIINSKFIIQS